jgi:hypothetical protein
MAPAPKPKLPADPEKLLEHYFNGSRLRLANAAGLSRAFINQWPMKSKIIMYEHILTALETELAAAKERANTLFGAKWAMKFLISNHRHESEAEPRVERPPGRPVFGYIDENTPSVPLTEEEHASTALLIEHMGDELAEFAA